MYDLNTYLNLITSEHRDKTKYQAFVRLLLTPIINLQNLHHSMMSMLNLDTSTGKQLDIIGGILGLSRKVNFQPTGGESPILDDDYYRLILKAKVAKNQWDGTKKGLYDLWENLFPHNPVLLVDRQNMTATVAVVGLTDQLSRDLILHGYIVPKPVGVLYEYGFTDRPIYSQNLDTEWLKGFDEGYWFDFEEIIDGDN